MLVISGGFDTFVDCLTRRQTRSIPGDNQSTVAVCTPRLAHRVELEPQELNVGVRLVDT